MDILTFITKEEKWAKEQTLLKKKLIIKDDESLSNIKYIGGMDISFDKKIGSDVACATLVVLSYPDLDPVYESHKICKMKEPYISGFLAFREVEFLVELWDALLSHPDYKKFEPQVIFVDGNGILHHRGFGLASHLGVLIDKPTIGCAKKLLHLDGLYEKNIKKEFRMTTTKAGEGVKLIGESGVLHGIALKTADDVINPIYVSIGHKISLETSIDLTTKSSIYKEPEAVRLADQYSRRYLREDYKPKEESKETKRSKKTKKPKEINV